MLHTLFRDYCEDVMEHMQNVDEILCCALADFLCEHSAELGVNIVRCPGIRSFINSLRELNQIVQLAIADINLVNNVDEILDAIRQRLIELA